MKLKRQLIVFAATFLIAYCAVKLAQADEGNEIEWNGRTEPAECHVEYTEPPITICVSESWLCRIQGGDMNCEIKR